MFGLKKHSEPVKPIADKTELAFKNSQKQAVRDLLPCGIADVSESYLIVNDGGRDYYVRAMTIAKMPKSSVFAVTFPRMTTFPNVDAEIYFEPLPSEKAQKQLDRKLTGIEADLGAEKNTNKKRRLQEAYQSTVEWQRKIETGMIRLYGVQFLFLIYARTLKDLDVATKKFVNEVRGSMEVVACYAAQAEAFKSCAPFNTIYDLKRGLLRSKICPQHEMDDGALCTIFPHTSFSYSHESGIPVGTVRGTGGPFFHDCFHPTHEGYSMLFAGKPGTGKSVCVKVSAARYRELYRTRFACIDTKPVDGRGEYSVLCEELQGVNFVLAPGSSNKLNLFAVQIEEVFDSSSGEVVPTLNLAQKINTLTTSLLHLAFAASPEPDVELYAAAQAIVRNSVSDVYDLYGIIDGEPTSLFYSEDDGQVYPKAEPVFSEFFLALLRRRDSDAVESHRKAYDLLLDVYREYLDDLYYTADYRRVSYEEAVTLSGRNAVEHISAGSRPYFDGQSTATFDASTPFVNFDISTLSETERYIAQLIVLEYIMDNIVRQNGTDKNASRLIVLVDEAHRILRQQRAADLLDDAVRTVRTRMASIWLVLQSVKDISDLQNSESLLRNMAAMYLFKHELADLDYIKRVTNLTDPQCAQIATLGGGSMDPKSVRKGECCVIDNQRPLFVNVTYLQDTEWRFAESDRDRRARLMERERQMRAIGR